MAEIGIVVVSYNSRGNLRDCVADLARDDSIEVVVVDNASQDGSLEAVSDVAARLIQLTDNRGFGAGCNVGWRATTAPFVLFLNPDARIEAAAVHRLAAVLRMDVSVGAVAPKILAHDGTVDTSLRRYPRVRSTFAQALFLHRLFPTADWTDELIRGGDAYRHARLVDWASGACLLVRRDLLERLGGFDERFFMYCEDMDLCKRIADAGYGIRFEPGAVATHTGGESSPRGKLLPVLAASRIRYARKHRGVAGEIAERAGIALGAATHGLAGRGGWAVRAGHCRAIACAIAPKAAGQPS
jgi:N-acetylglucosaminyl-diphospho-decaprenol L-rhamnosyltransferase